jgi:hypothetical protein
MSGPTGANGRDDGGTWVEGLLTGAGASIGRVLDDRQVHAASLAIEVFAYLLAALPSDRVDVRDVIRMLKYYSKGINDAKGEQG